MPNPATAITLVGATGLTGGAALSSLPNSSSNFAITTLTRKPLERGAKSGSTNLNRVYADLKDAASDQICSPKGVYVTCLGTTKVAAGGIKQQEQIDLVLNRELAQKARADGADTVGRPSLHENIAKY